MSDKNKQPSNDLEKAMEQFGAFLVEMDLSVEQINDINSAITETVLAHTLAEVSKLMSAEDKEKWDKFTATGPNDMQQLVIMDEFCKRRGEEGLGEIQARMMIKLTESFIDHIKSLQDEADLANGLPQEEIEHLLKSVKGSKKAKSFDNKLFKLNRSI